MFKFEGLGLRVYGGWSDLEAWTPHFGLLGTLNQDTEALNTLEALQKPTHVLGGSWDLVSRVIST